MHDSSLSWNLSKKYLNGVTGNWSSSSRTWVRSSSEC